MRRKRHTGFSRYVHAPIETDSRASLQNADTPNQVTIAGFIIGCGATAAFALGRVGLGLLASLAFGIVDDSMESLSRVKVGNNRTRKWNIISII